MTGNLGYTWGLVAWTVLVMGAVVVRAMAVNNDLWLDEIWSLRLASDVASPVEIFTAIHHDNNHYLNTLWLHFVGSGHGSVLYRLPALAASAGTVVCAGLIGLRRSIVTCLITTVLTGYSYMLIVVTTEARGYSIAVLSSLASYWALDTYLEHRSARAAIAYQALAFIGAISHPIFVSFYLAAVIWTVAHEVRRGGGVGGLLGTALKLHATTGAALATLFAIDLRHMHIGGGRQVEPLTCYGDAIAWMVALPEVSHLWGCALAAGVLSLGLWLLRREGKGYVFFPAVIVVIPLALAVLRGSGVLYVRYFVIASVFWLLLCGVVGGWLYERGRQARLACITLLTLHLIGNGVYIRSLLQSGRGDYTAALQFIASRSGTEMVSVAGDHDTRVGQVLAYHATRSKLGKKWIYVGADRMPREGVLWVIVHKESFESPEPPFRVATDDFGNHYDFVRTFPATPLSGFHWFVYERRQTRNAAS